MVIYICFDLYNADSNKENSVFQILRDIEEYKKKRKKARSTSRRLLIITFVWVVNMLCLIPLPKLLEDPSEKQDKDILRLRASGTIPTGKYIISPPFYLLVNCNFSVRLHKSA